MKTISPSPVPAFFPVQTTFQLTLFPTFLFSVSLQSCCCCGTGVAASSFV